MPRRAGCPRAADGLDRLSTVASSATTMFGDANYTYDPLNVEKGVQYMQLLGVKYYMAFSPAAVKEARQQSDLTEVASSGPWGNRAGRRAQWTEPSCRPAPPPSESA